jgi:PBP1b-binding outer membrane lipoprotein LpoB
MKTIQINKSLIAVIFVAVILSACASSKDFLSENFSRVRNTHQRIAILPFDVQFENLNNRGNEPKKQRFFSKQEREASLDAQKELFTSVARQVQKGRYEIAFQDFTRTNKVLSENGIKLEDIARQNKADIAKLLGVDAVIAGDLAIRITQIDMRSPQMMPPNRNNDGVETNVKLFDAASGEMLWATNLSQRPNNQMDTPHHLSTQLINQVAKNLPYRMK